MIILLYTAATPFSPIVWMTYEMEGSFFFDRFLSGVLLFSAMYFQWRIAKQEFPVVITLATGPSKPTVSNGHLTQVRGELAWLYRPDCYWQYLAIEAGMLGVAEYLQVEILRRFLVIGVVGVLWALGWFVTPQRVKNEAWGYIKTIWMWVAFDEILRIGRGGTRRRRW